MPYPGTTQPSLPLVKPLAYPAVAPEQARLAVCHAAKKATYIDPTVSIENGNSVVIGFQNFIGPYANLNGGGGAIKIGNTSSMLDNATIVANPGLRHQKPEVLIGDQVVIGFGAQVDRARARSAISALRAAPTSIGAGALIDGATIDRARSLARWPASGRA